MNELADEVGIDPLDLRLANFAEVSPADGRPWSSNRLREAYAEGARRYGWRDRHERPRRTGRGGSGTAWPPARWAASGSPAPRGCA